MGVGDPPRPAIAQARVPRENALQPERETARSRAKLITDHHGQLEEETTSEDVETQTSEAPEGESSQETYVAKVTLPRSTSLKFILRTRPRWAGFLLF